MWPFNKNKNKHRHNFVTIAETNASETITTFDLFWDYFSKKNTINGVVVYSYCDCGKHKAEFVTSSERKDIEIEYARSIIGVDEVNELIKKRI